MDIDATFLPVADTLINATFPTSITYHRAGNKTYDPTTGTVTGTDTDYAINAGVLSRRRVEEGGPSETYELMLWVEHKTLRCCRPRLTRSRMTTRSGRSQPWIRLTAAKAGSHPGHLPVSLMPVFRDPKRLQQHLKKAMDALQAEVVITTQAELGSRKCRRLILVGSDQIGLLLKASPVARQLRRPTSHKQMPTA